MIDFAVVAGSVSVVVTVALNFHAPSLAIAPLGLAQVLVQPKAVCIGTVGIAARLRLEEEKISDLVDTRTGEITGIECFNFQQTTQYASASCGMPASPRFAGAVEIRPANIIAATRTYLDDYENA
jgi:hypothetical protein